MLILPTCDVPCWKMCQLRKNNFKFMYIQQVGALINNFDWIPKYFTLNQHFGILSICSVLYSLDSRYLWKLISWDSKLNTFRNLFCSLYEQNVWKSRWQTSEEQKLIIVCYINITTTVKNTYIQNDFFKFCYRVCCKHPSSF